MFKQSLYLTLVLFGAQASAASMEVAPTEEAGNPYLTTLQKEVASLSAEELEKRYADVQVQHNQSVEELTKIFRQARAKGAPVFQHADYQTYADKSNKLALEKRIVGTALELLELKKNSEEA